MKAFGSLILATALGWGLGFSTAWADDGPPRTTGQIASAEACPALGTPCCMVDDCPACDESRLYGSVEYLMWWMRGVNLPPLVTQGSILDPGVAGAIGQPNTIVLFGDSTAGTEPNHGARLNVGYWLNDCHTVGVEANWFFLAQRNSQFPVSNNGDVNGTTVLARPFIDETTGMPNAQQIALPGQSGSIVVNQERRLMGAEANVRFGDPADDCFRLDFLAGFRFLALDDGIDIQTTSTDLTGVAEIANATSFDSFAARNRFYGGQIGASAQYCVDSWVFTATGKVALGGNEEIVHIEGGTTFTDITGATSFAHTGLLAQPTNIGHYERTVFSCVPELSLTAGYRFSDRLSAFVGYTILWETNVVRAGNQIDVVSNTPTLLGPLPTGQTHPAFHFQSSDFWAQGVSVGVMFRF